MITGILFCVGLLIGAVVSNVFNLFECFSNSNNRYKNDPRLEDSHKDKVQYVLDNAKLRLSKLVINTKPDVENFIYIYSSVSNDMTEHLKLIPDDKFMFSYEKYLDFLESVIRSSDDPNYINVAKWYVGMITNIRGVE
jgi:hypothetical protein